LSLHVCAPLFYESEDRARILSATAAAHGISPVFFGVGQKWEGFWESKFLGFREHLASVDREYTLVLDANDCVFLAGEEQILEAYERARNGHDILLQGAYGLYPHKLHRIGRHFRDLADGRGFGHPYPCAGLILGRTDALRRACNVLYEMWSEVPVWFPNKRDDDQGWWELGIYSGRVAAQIDYKAIVSLGMYRQKLWWFRLNKEQEGEELYGIVEPTKILHFTGWGRPGGMLSWWNRNAPRLGISL